MAWTRADAWATLFDSKHSPRQEVPPSHSKKKPTQPTDNICIAVAFCREAIVTRAHGSAALHNNEKVSGIAVSTLSKLGPLEQHVSGQAQNIKATTRSNSQATCDFTKQPPVDECRNEYERKRALLAGQQTSTFHVAHIQKHMLASPSRHRRGPWHHHHRLCSRTSST